MASMARFKVASLYTRILQDSLSPDIIDMTLSYLGLDSSSFRTLHHFPELAGSALGFPAMDHNNHHPAETPPPNGKCPFMTLPTELRRAIFAESLPARDITIPVRCEDDDHKKNSKDDNHSRGDRAAVHPTTTSTTSSSSSSSPSPSSTPSSAKAIRPRTLDLLTLNRALCAELTELLYTEREFAVHVHEGSHAGGIEFLNSGRQPLQFYGYVDDEDDDEDDGCGGGVVGRRIDPRFAGKFHSGAPFGLDRVKKVRVVVLPPPPPPSRLGKEGERKEDARMVAMNTYYMNLALVRLLERAEGGKGRENRITKLRVEVADRRRRCNPSSSSSSSSSSFDSSWWWDCHRSRPRETTFHGISNLQLVLLPFSRLRAHHVEILLPPSCAAQLASDPGTRAFLRRLEGKITGSSFSSAAAAAEAGLDDLLDDEKVLRNLEKARFAYEAFVFRVKFGGKGEEGALLGDEDWEGEKVQEIAAEEEEEKGDRDAEEGGGSQLQRGGKNKKKKKNGKKRSGRKDKKGTGWASDDDDDDDDSEGDEVEMQWALQQSLDQAAEEAEKELQQAIRESLRDDRQGSPGLAKIDDRDREYHRGVSEDVEEMRFEDDEYDMDLSEGMDEFAFEDDEEEPGVSEDGGESDSNDGKSSEGGKKMRETVSKNDEYDSALKKDSETTDAGDDEEDWNGYYEGTEEGRAKAREFHSRRKKKSKARLSLVEPFATTGQMGIDVWQVTGTTSINSTTTFPDGKRFGQPVAAKRDLRMAGVEGDPGENTGHYSVKTGWEEEAVSVSEDITPEYIAEAAGPDLGGVTSGTCEGGT
ncbi:hypothetical protein KC354_g16742 [Hortaea werneckii]|nr:hypothetical protein KC354_g16742 [Hortaea werneckii]